MALIDLVRATSSVFKYIRKNRSTKTDQVEVAIQAALDGCTDNIWNYEQFVDKSGSSWDWSPALEQWDSINRTLVSVSSGNVIGGGLYVPAGRYGMSRTFSYSNATTSGSNTYMSQLSISGEGQNNTQFYSIGNPTVLFWAFNCRVRLQGFSIIGNDSVGTYGLRLGKVDSYNPVMLSSVRDIRIQGFDVLLHCAHVFDSQFDMLHLTLWGSIGCLIDNHVTDNSNHLLFNRPQFETAALRTRGTATTAFKIVGGGGSSRVHQNIQLNCPHFETVDFFVTLMDVRSCIDSTIVAPSFNRNRYSGQTTPSSQAAPILVVDSVSNINFLGGKLQHIGGTASNVAPLVVAKNNVVSLNFVGVFFATGNSSASNIASAFDVSACTSGDREIFLDRCRINDFVNLPSFSTKVVLAQADAVNRRFVQETLNVTRAGVNVQVLSTGFSNASAPGAALTPALEVYSSGFVKPGGGLLAPTLTVDASATATWVPGTGVLNGRGHYRIVSTSNDVQSYAEFYSVPGQAPLVGLVGSSFNVGINSATAVSGKVNFYLSGNGIVVDNRTSSAVTVGIMFTAAGA